MRTQRVQARKTLGVLLIAGVFATILGATPALAASTGPGLLAKLKVAAERPAGYDRDKFNHWITVPGRGCDTRDFVLFRQNLKRPRRCGDEVGRWISIFDGRKISRSTGLDVDHMVPLAEAWGSGGHAWTPAQREAFANDLYAFSLVAVSLSSNRSKGDSDPAEWLPPRSAFTCPYLARWTAVKYRWRLTVDSREKRAISRRFKSCPRKTLRLPTIQRAKVPVSQGGGAGGKTDPRFETCTAAIAAGYGPYKRGVDREYEWYEDRDGDGLVCER